jgi:multiple sugar transport system substrate-binding protein
MIKIIFSTVGDPPPIWRRFVREFNRQHRGTIRVRLWFRNWNIDFYLDELRRMFRRGGSEIDVITGDVIWSAEFATIPGPGGIEDFSDRFLPRERRQFLDATIEANTYDGRIWAVPSFTDVGLLYYRKDLLDLSGFFCPPKTWDQLKQMALQVKKDSRIRYGFVFPGAEYEGGVYCGLEYIWTHGGDVLDPQNPRRVIINTPETVKGLTTERSMIEDGVSPQDVASYTEDESVDAFLSGRAVFYRGWPWLLPVFGTRGASLGRDQVDVAPIPAGEGGQSYGCLGGWNLSINAASDAAHQDAAWEFIQFMTSAANQKDLAIRDQLMPTRKVLYDDADVLRVPIIPRGKAALDRTRARPTHPRYSKMSAVMAEEFNRCLRGQVPAARAAQNLQRRLFNIVRR